MNYKAVRQIRIVLSLLFFTATVTFLTVGPASHPMAAAIEKTQILPSMLAVSIGAILFWTAMTFAAGRIYCSTACPVGTLQDIFIRLGKAVNKKKEFSYKSEIRYRGRWHILAIYMLCVAIGLGAVAWLLEPWNIMRNICAAARPSVTAQTWMTLGVGATAGILAGIISLFLIALSAILSGRDFCNTICPIGSAMAAITPWTVCHIEIDPDRCSGCLKCEQVCKASCIKVISRHVDNSRCVRCFNCTAVCDDNAIRFQQQRNRPATPLMRKKARTP